jgi:hypothetical protein
MVPIDEQHRYGDQSGITLKSRCVRQRSEEEDKSQAAATAPVCYGRSLAIVNPIAHNRIARHCIARY